jgi:hypothetical protein
MQRTKLALGMPIALAASVVEFSMLRRARPHPLGLDSTPAAMPRMLESHGWGPGLTEMVLAYGYPFDASKPLIEGGHVLLRARLRSPFGGTGTRPG